MLIKNVNFSSMMTPRNFTSLTLRISIPSTVNVEHRSTWSEGTIGHRSSDENLLRYFLTKPLKKKTSGQIHQLIKTKQEKLSFFFVFFASKLRRRNASVRLQSANPSGNPFESQQRRIFSVFRVYVLREPWGRRTGGSTQSWREENRTSSESSQSKLSITNYC